VSGRRGPTGPVRPFRYRFPTELTTVAG
jgi:hypothetical protein